LANTAKLGEVMAAELPPGQQLVAPGKWPIIGERFPENTGRPWSLTIQGQGQSKTFSLDQLRDFRQSENVIDIHCVTRWSKLGVKFRGVRLADLIAQFRPLDEAQFISFVSRSSRRHSTSLTMATALQQDTLIALEVDGEPLPEVHGGPIRNIVPGRYFYKSVKWLETIELLQHDRLGYWEAESGYHNEADPWREQRYMAPTVDRRKSAELIATRNFSGQDLRSIDASQRDLRQLQATNALLRDANFSNSDLESANFSQANLSNAHFSFSNLRKVNFRNADLEGADFSAADLRQTDFTGSSLIGSSFFDPDSPEESAAIIDPSTVLPAEVLAPLFPEQLAFVKNSLAGKAR
jgi:DMSO/TMAO reductase YedYZ molybdopterin-dependent catalytic subunit